MEIDGVKDGVAVALTTEPESRQEDSICSSGCDGCPV